MRIDLFLELVQLRNLLLDCVNVGAKWAHAGKLVFSSLKELEKIL